MQQDNNRMSQAQTPAAANGENGENTLNLRDIIFLVLNNWYWFVISVLVCLAVAGVYYKMQPKSYSASGTILVRDNDNRRSTGKANMDAILSNMGMDNSMLSLENEMYMLRSSSLMSQVVRRLGLNHYCTRDDMFRKVTYYKDEPISLEVYDENMEREIELHMKVKPTGGNNFNYTAYDFHSSRASVLKKGTGTFGHPMNLDDSVVVVISKTKFFNPACEGVDFNIGVSRVYPLARRMIGHLNVSRVDKMASVLSITFEDANSRRANEIVDTLIAVYNDDAVEDKNKVAQKTEQFISDRITLISGELDDVDAQVEHLKRQSQLPETEGAGSALLQTSTRYSEQVVALETELRLIRDMRAYIDNPSNQYELIPVQVGISDAGIQGMISQYNNVANMYRRLKDNAGPNNPQAKSYRQQMDAQLEAIKSAVNNLLSATTVRVQDARAQEASARSKISALPGQTKAVTEVTRQQKIKEELYLYLLSKREETAMNLAVTISNAKVVEPAIVGLKGPRLMMFALVAIVLGLAIPAAVFFLVNFFDVKLRSKFDVEKNTTIPVLGEIPQKPATRVNDEIIVTATGTDVVTEAFRLLHSNIPFFLKDGQKVIQNILSASENESWRTPKSVPSAP